VIAAVLLFAWVLHTSVQTPSTEDPELRAAVERFYELQQKEDVEGYLSLWSPSAKRPTAAQLKYIFDNGDDVFSDIQFTRAIQSGNRVRLRVDVRRQRTLPPHAPGAVPVVVNSVMHVALTYEWLAGEWKLLREGSAADDLAAEIVDAHSDARREELMAEEPELNGPLLLAALARLGSIAAAAGEYARSQAVFERLVQIAHDGGYKKEEGEALQNIANSFYFRRQFPEALAAYERRLALERERGDEAAIASALGGVATIRYSFAEYTEALARYREALAIHERLDDVAGIAFAALSIGNITYLQGDFQTAIASYRRSLELHKTMANADGESRALEGLGLVFSAQGDYAGALESFDAVQKDPRMRNYRDRLGSVAQSAGDVHFRLGNLDTARAAYEQSRAQFESLKDIANVGRVLQPIGLTDVVAGRFVQAEDLYQRSGSICMAAGDKECTARATAGFAYAQAAQDKFFDAAASYRGAIGEFMALDRREDAARAEIGLSQALAGAGDFAGAIEAAGRARAAAALLENDDVLWRALTAEAKAVRRNGQKDRAIGLARTAVATIDRMQTFLADRPGGSVPTDAAAAMATFAVLQAETGDADGAFATSERLRGLHLRAALATNERDIARGMTPTERDEERELSSQVLTRLAQLTRENGLPKPDPARIATLEKAVAEASGARRAWLQRLFERLPELRVWRGFGPSRTAADAAPLLESEGTLLLSFVLDDEDVLILTLTHRRKEAVAVNLQEPAPPAGHVSTLSVDAYVTPIKRRDVAERVAALQQPGVVGDLMAWRKAAVDLVALLPRSVIDRLASASRVLILPHDVLWRVPFEALPIGRDLLIDRATVVLSGSVDELLRSNATSSGTPEAPLVIGAPQIESSRLDRLRQVTPGWNVRASELADREMKTVADLYSSKRPAVLAHEMATESAVRSRLADAALLHIALPFRINPASPLFSPILLTAVDAPASSTQSAQNVAISPTAAAAVSAASRKESTDDGTLELRELMNLNLRAPLAVLSDGAATTMRDAAAAVDVIEWGWLAAGVPSLLLSRWASPGGSSDQLLAEFHKRVRDGASPADALREAQLAVRRGDKTAAPVHWAGWMFLGK
jgi:tetratricopeptide (TPR) repeat protein/CHAT domain-containing protein